MDATDSISSHFEIIVYVQTMLAHPTHTIDIIIIINIQI